MTAPTRIPLGGRAIPEPGKFLLQERTSDGAVVREFEHDAAHCAAEELVKLHGFQPDRYDGLVTAWTSILAYRHHRGLI